MSSPAPDLVSPAPAPLTPPEKIVRAVFDTVTVGVALPRVIGPENSKPVAPAIVKLWLIVTALGMALMPVRSVFDWIEMGLAGAVPGSPKIKAPVPSAFLWPKKNPPRLVIVSPPAKLLLPFNV